MQTGLVTWTTENHRRATTSSSTDVAQYSIGVSRTRPQLLFLHQKQNIRAWQQQFKKHYIWNNIWGIAASKKNISVAIGEDNQSCIKLCQNSVMHKRRKHIETEFHFNRDKTEGATVSIHYVPTDKMASDIFKKFLYVSKVETFRTVLMETDSTQSAQVWVGC